MRQETAVFMLIVLAGCAGSGKKTDTDIYQGA